GLDAGSIPAGDATIRSTKKPALAAGFFVSRHATMPRGHAEVAQLHTQARLLRTLGSSLWLQAGDRQANKPVRVRRQQAELVRGDDTVRRTEGLYVQAFCMPASGLLPFFRHAGSCGEQGIGGGVERGFRRVLDDTDDEADGDD